MLTTAATAIAAATTTTRLQFMQLRHQVKFSQLFVAVCEIAALASAVYKFDFRV